MKKIRYNNLRFILFLSLGIFVFSSCERDFSDEVQFATFPTNPDIFTDAPVGLTDEFFKSFDPALGANTEGFGTDDDIAFEGSSSIRIDVPAPDDPNGGFIGGIFLDRGAGRDLTGFDALTFYAKGSTTATIDEVGFGTDFEEDKFAVGIQNIRLSTDWKKVIIPIPDSSKLVQERGMFRFSTGTLSTNGVGFTFWIDELRFEKLGTIAQSRPAILNGVDVVQEGFLDIPVELTGLTQTFNVGSGENVTVVAKPSYFDFQTTDVDVARANELGVVSVVGTGEATITASLANVAAAGSLILNVLGDFDFAPIPERNAEDVISIFSDSYNNVNVDFFNGFFGGQTTQGGAIAVADESVIRYTDLNFVTVQFANPTVDASQMTHIHIDIKVQEPLGPGDSLTVELGDFGGDGVFGGVGSDDSAGSSPPIDSSQLVNDEWIGIDIPLTDFTGGTGGGFSGLTNTSNLAQLSFVSGTVSNILVDNIYLYRE